nr:unnamed protein product [Callosobruchus chinensis]
MGRKKLKMEGKSRALTLLEKGDTVSAVARDLGVSRETIYQLKRSASMLPPGEVPIRKKGSGAPRKTSKRTDELLRREVLKSPSITAVELKHKHQDLLKDVATRTIRHRLQKDLGLPTRRSAKKPLLTEAMKKKRLAFCKKYQDWTSDDWKKVMFSDESTFRLFRGGSQMLRRPSNVSRYDPKYTIKTVRHPDSVMVWGAFSGVKGRAGLHFLPKGQTMKASNYIDVLKEHMVIFMGIHQCVTFMHDGAPAHKANVVTKFLKDEKIDVLEWPGNSPDLNPIENAWNHMKNKVKEKRPGSIPELKDVLKTLWCNMDVTYLEKLAESMPKRLQMVLKAKGNMTKY